MPNKISIALWLMFLSPLAPAVVAQQAEVGNEHRIRVKLSDGRILDAAADSNTNEHYLVLRFESPGILLQKPVPWTDIEYAEVDEKQWSASELKVHWRQSGFPVASDPFIWNRPSDSMQRLPAGSTAVISDSRSSQSTEVRARLASLSIEAVPANWDADPLVDGLLLFVRPFDEAGNATPVDGTLAWSLTAQSMIPTARMSVQRQKLPVLETGQLQVKQADFQQGTAVYRLEYTKLNPELARDLADHGKLDARLQAVGQGVFEATHAHIPLRPPSTLRDWHWQHSK